MKNHKPNNENNNPKRKFNNKTEVIKFIKERTFVNGEVIGYDNNISKVNINLEDPMPKENNPKKNETALILEEMKKMNSKIDDEMKKMNSKIDNEMKKMNSKIDDEMKKVNSKIDDLRVEFTSRLDKVDIRLDKIESRLEKVEKDVATLKEDVSELKSEAINHGWKISNNKYLK